MSKRPDTVDVYETLSIVQRWTPSFGQVFVTAKVESGVMIQATLG